MNKEKRSSERKDLIYIGQIKRAHGIKGEVSAEELTESAEVYRKKDEVYLIDQERIKRVEIKGFREHKGRLLIKFEELKTLAEAKEWVGSYIAIPPYDYPKAANEYKVHEIVGLKVVDDEGYEIGKVVEIKDYSANYLLAVEKDKKRVLVPFAEEYCLVDLENGLIKISKDKWEELNEL